MRVGGGSFFQRSPQSDRCPRAQEFSGNFDGCRVKNFLGGIFLPKKISERTQKRNERMQALVEPAQAGDADAIGELWLLYDEVAKPIVRNYLAKYPFVDGDDLQQGCSLYFHKILARYDPNNAAGNSFAKYAYHRIFFTCKDLLRQRDDLGIGWPQKNNIPSGIT